MIRVLHLAAHLGGGVGKALAGLTRLAYRSDGCFEHAVLCLERPENSQFVDQVRQTGARLTFCPQRLELISAIEDADIVQIEFWNHPALMRALCEEALPPMRLVVWSHVSGLSYPRIPPGLLVAAHKFLFTSDCSFEAGEVLSLDRARLTNLGVVSSGGGLESLPEVDRTRKGEMRAGYIGSLNQAKLHPEFVSFLAAIRQADFKCRMIGDEINKASLLDRCRRENRPDLLEFRGYRTDSSAELSELDILIYLLNPEHYGTAENALLEAMAMGVVPIVLDNAAERRIVNHLKTGIVVRTPEDLANAMEWLGSDWRERVAIGRRASQHVRRHYRHERMDLALNRYYGDVMSQDKSYVPFRTVFGEGPADWFRAFERDPRVFSDSGMVTMPENRTCDAYFERTKGSVFHFMRYFPDDIRLQGWGSSLRTLSSLRSASDSRSGQ